jgi:hypothetical protein
MTKILYDIDAFFKGYKPAILYNYNTEWGRHEEDKEARLHKYPSINAFVHDMDQVIYFQSKELRDSFQKKIDGIEPDTSAYYKELGLILGFPPKAVQFYCDWLVDESLKWERVSLEFCGICCVGAIKDIKENVEWFWKLPIPEDAERGIKIGFTTATPVVSYYIPYNETEHLQTILEEIQWIANKRKRALEVSAL